MTTALEMLYTVRAAMEETFLNNVKDVLDITDRELSLDDDFRSMPEWSSLTFLSMIAMIDEEYGVVIDGNKFKLLETLSDILEAIKAAKA